MKKKEKYLLDTNILSDLIRNPQGRVVEKIATVGESVICTSIIVASELRFGAEKRQSKKLTNQLELILSAIKILPFEAPADHHYAEIRSFLESNGKMIGPNDLLIASHALSVNCTVVTANEREFCRVPELKVENWLSL